MDKIYIVIGFIIFWILGVMVSLLLSLFVYKIFYKLSNLDVIHYYLGNKHNTSLLRGVYKIYQGSTKKGMGRYILKYRLRNIKSANRK